MTEDNLNVYLTINRTCRHLSSLYKKNLDDACIKYLQRKYGFNIITKPITTMNKLIESLNYVKHHSNELFSDSAQEVSANCDRYISYLKKAFNVDGIS